MESNVTLEGGAITDSGEIAVYFGSPRSEGNGGAATGSSLDFVSTFHFCDAQNLLALTNDVTLRLFARDTQPTENCLRRIIAPESHIVSVFMRFKREVGSSVEVMNVYDGPSLRPENIIDTLTVSSSSYDVLMTSLSRTVTLQLLVREEYIQYAEARSVESHGMPRNRINIPNALLAATFTV